MWNCHVNFGSVWLAQEILVLCPLLLLQAFPSIKIAHKLIEIMLALRQMGGISAPAALEVMAPETQTPAHKTKDSSQMTKLASLLPSCIITALFPSPLPPTSVSQGSSLQLCCHIPCPHTLVWCIKYGLHVCRFFPAPHPPLPFRWWMGCKTDIVEDKCTGEISACATKWRWLAEITWQSSGSAATHHNCSGQASSFPPWLPMAFFRFTCCLGTCYCCSHAYSHCLCEAPECPVRRTATPIKRYGWQ